MLSLPSFPSFLTSTTPSAVNGGQLLGTSGPSSFFNMRTFFIILLVALFIGVAYYVYTRQTVKPNSDYRDNANAGSTGPGSGKEAELMLFYVDWCPHCKTAKPEWEQVKTEYEGKTINGYSIVFTEINCTNETPDTEKLMNTYKIEGYPTIKLLKDGQVIEFDAKPTKAHLEQFLKTVL